MMAVATALAACCLFFAAGSGNVMSQMMDDTLYNDVMALAFGKFCFGSQTEKLVAPRYVP